MLSRAFRVDRAFTPLWHPLKIKNSFIRPDIVQETFFVSFYCNHYYYYYYYYYANVVYRGRLRYTQNS